MSAILVSQFIQVRSRVKVHSQASKTLTSESRVLIHPENDNVCFSCLCKRDDSFSQVVQMSLLEHYEIIIHSRTTRLTTNLDL
jgi:hypothetical protein